jgi:MoxR-like ATPase
MDLTTVIAPEAFNTADVIKNESVRFSHLTNEVSKIIVGQENILHFINIALLCNGHILLEGVPGVAKTTMIKAVTAALGLSFKRIQFTPDLLPADLIGTLIYNQKTQDFETKKGPLFANLILADEINRAPAKVQAALLEAMQEHQVTIGSQTFFLEEPFLVFATQNPIENEGTYRLPEAQVDRFMFKLLVHYQNKDQEKKIVENRPPLSTIQQILSNTDIIRIQQLVNTIYVDSKIVDYIVNIIFATRNPHEHNLPELQPYIKYGVSPRATLALHHAAKAHAFLKERHFVTPDDVKAVCAPILRHRILLTYHAEAENITTEIIIKKILQAVPSP